MFHQSDLQNSTYNNSFTETVNRFYLVEHNDKEKAFLLKIYKDVRDSITTSDFCGLQR